jgi:hypothetical protein
MITGRRPRPRRSGFVEISVFAFGGSDDSVGEKVFVFGLLGCEAVDDAGAKGMTACQLWKLMIASMIGYNESLLSYSLWY